MLLTFLLEVIVSASVSKVFEDPFANPFVTIVPSKEEARWNLFFNIITFGGYGWYQESKLEDAFKERNFTKLSDAIHKGACVQQVPLTLDILQNCNLFRFIIARTTFRRDHYRNNSPYAESILMIRDYLNEYFSREIDDDCFKRHLGYWRDSLREASFPSPSRAMDRLIPFNRFILSDELDLNAKREKIKKIKAVFDENLPTSGVPSVRSIPSAEFWHEMKYSDGSFVCSGQSFDRARQFPPEWRLSDKEETEVPSA